MTREIQHDLLPRSSATIGCWRSMGEARHRRSYLYDVATGSARGCSTTTPSARSRPSTRGCRAPTARSADRRRARRRHRLGRARRLPHGPDARGHARGAAGAARQRARRREGAARKGAAARTRRSPPTSARSSPRRRSHAVYGYEKALFDFDSKHITRPGQQAARRQYLFDTYQSFGYEPELPVVRRRAARSAASTANVLATLKGTVNPELVYVVSSHFDSVADRSGRRRRHVGHGGAARGGARAGRSIRSRRRSCSRRSPARRRACSAAASSCARRSPTRCRSSAR